MKNLNFIKYRQGREVSSIIGKTKVTIENKSYDRKILIIPNKLLLDVYDIVEKRVRIKKQKKKIKILHMKHGIKRETKCGIKYDNTIMHKFIPNQLAGQWKRVTCKKCLKRRHPKLSSPKEKKR